jgi:hypothetical protein
MDFKQFIIENIKVNTDGSISINPDIITSKMWETINNYMKRKGYDWRGADDAERIIRNMLKKDGRIDAKMFPNHAASIQYAFQLQEKRPERTSDQKTITAIKRHFGTTNNYNMAGYILPDGSMLNFSGKHHGAAENTRGEDHRAIGHFLDRENYNAIREFGERFGGISLHFGNNYSTMRIYQTPTNMQIKRIKEIKDLVEEMSLNMYSGQEESQKMYGKRDHSYLLDLKRFYGI